MTVLPRDSERDAPVDSTTAAELFFAAARGAGLAHVVLSPGSRSTALAIAVLRTPDLSHTVELDERVAAFVALGLAKRTGSPVALVCTSGTAAANYLPAVAEASMSNVPLVVVTADRPPEHQGWGVGQAFDQRGLYHRQVRDEITMPVGGDGGEAFCLRAGWRSVVTATEQAGPVHVNWAFRLPIEPTGPAIAPPQSPFSAPPSQTVDAAEVDYLVERLKTAKSPLIIAGPNTAHSGSARTLVQSVEALGVPVLADALSGLRGVQSSALVEAPSLVTTAPRAPSPDLIVHLGQTPTAKAIRLWWETTSAEHVLIDPQSLWHDPSHVATARLTSDPTLLLQATTDAIGRTVADSDWLEKWQTLGSAVATAVNGVLVGWPTTTEAHIARTLLDVLGATDQVIASSSMPVRDIDSFGSVRDVTTIVSNRGINGIDGVISTAMGAHFGALAQEASGHAQAGRTCVLIGDVAALHDVGGLLSAARNEVPLTVVIPNNDGGGIFSFLPIRDVLDDADFDELFHTPHGTTFEAFGGHESITYRQASDLRNALIETASIPGVVLIEMMVDTPERLGLGRAIQSAINDLPS